ncbi:MAG: general stress protein [Firmicutes bacterium]|nr:general stress protein [Bacillota bacterium]
MSKTVIGVFKSRQQAETAVDDLRRKGFTNNEISIVAKEATARGGQTGTRGGQGGGFANDNLSNGTLTGGTIGGLAGLLAGAGALAIPGVGPILAAGPIAAGLTGAVTGGIAGGLLDLGIPEARGRFYEEEVKRGSILTVIKSDEKKVSEAASILRQNGATDVETH